MVLSSTKDGAAARVDKGRPTILTIVCSALDSVGIGERSRRCYCYHCGAKNM